MYYKCFCFVIFLAKASTSTSTSTSTSSSKTGAAVHVNYDKPAKSFEAYRTSKSKDWANRVSKGKGKGKNKEEVSSEVTIYIGLMSWNTKEGKLKPKRGKKLILKIPANTNYNTLRMEATKKWQNFYSDLYEENQLYVILYEDGKQAKFLPGKDTEAFSLKKYKEELGRDYNRITMYLCTSDDFNFSPKVISLMMTLEMKMKMKMLT